MKRIQFIPVLAVLFFMASCDNDKENEMSDAAEKNLAAMHGITKCFDTKDFSNLGNYIAEDAVDHAGENGEVIGLANMKEEFVKMSNGMENAKTEVIKELADSEYVMSWMRFTGSLTKDMMGMKAGQNYDMTAIEVARFKDGKAVEHWTFMQPSEMMNMMGNMPMPAMMPGQKTE